jgi:dethiobiotin synthetase
MKSIFITGTDTGVGKTFVSQLLLNQFNQLGLKTFGLKPIASGGKYNRYDQLENEDALILQKNSSIYQPYSIVNPIILNEPIAPHLAACHMNIVLTKSKLKKCILASLQPDADINIIEGAGGWSVPLNYQELYSDVIAELNIPVVLVVGIKLGCLNHALLTYYNILQMKVALIGWIANCFSPSTLYSQENIDSLKQIIKHPCLGAVPYKSQFKSKINLEKIQQHLF